MKLKLRITLILSVASLLATGATTALSAPAGGQSTTKSCKIIKPVKDGKNCRKVKPHSTQRPPIAPTPARPLSECLNGVIPRPACEE
jgi:hypothetical protein